ncbi:unnamed protein product [Amoebophrya sp. A120]|nr:unnamed protein product [Amoebophrya sp. A120]|eukprot:GSA120T00014876001.1
MAINLSRTRWCSCVRTGESEVLHQPYSSSPGRRCQKTGRRRASKQIVYSYKFPVAKGVVLCVTNLLGPMVSKLVFVTFGIARWCHHFVLIDQASAVSSSNHGRDGQKAASSAFLRPRRGNNYYPQTNSLKRRLRDHHDGEVLPSGENKGARITSSSRPAGAVSDVETASTSLTGRSNLLQKSRRKNSRDENFLPAEGSWKRKNLLGEGKDDVIAAVEGGEKTEQRIVPQMLGEDEDPGFHYDEETGNSFLQRQRLTKAHCAGGGLEDETTTAEGLSEIPEEQRTTSEHPVRNGGSNNAAVTGDDGKMSNSKDMLNTAMNKNFRTTAVLSSAADSIPSDKNLFQLQERQLAFFSTDHAGGIAGNGDLPQPGGAPSIYENYGMISPASISVGEISKTPSTIIPSGVLSSSPGHQQPTALGLVLSNEILQKSASGGFLGASLGAQFNRLRDTYHRQQGRCPGGAAPASDWWEAASELTCARQCILDDLCAGYEVEHMYKFEIKMEERITEDDDENPRGLGDDKEVDLASSTRKSSPTLVRDLDFVLCRFVRLVWPGMEFTFPTHLTRTGKSNIVCGVKKLSLLRWEREEMFSVREADGGKPSSGPQQQSEEEKKQQSSTAFSDMDFARWEQDEEEVQTENDTEATSDTSITEDQQGDKDGTTNAPSDVDENVETGAEINREIEGNDFARTQAPTMDDADQGPDQDLLSTEHTRPVVQPPPALFDSLPNIVKRPQACLAAFGNWTPLEYVPVWNGTKVCHEDGLQRDRGHLSSIQASSAEHCRMACTYQVRSCDAWVWHGGAQVGDLKNCWLKSVKRTKPPVRPASTLVTGGVCTYEEAARGTTSAGNTPAAAKWTLTPTCCNGYRLEKLQGVFSLDYVLPTTSSASGQHDNTNATSSSSSSQKQKFRQYYEDCQRKVFGPLLARPSMNFTTVVRGNECDSIFYKDGLPICPVETNWFKFFNDFPIKFDKALEMKLRPTIPWLNETSNSTRERKLGGHYDIPKTWLADNFTEVIVE